MPGRIQRGWEEGAITASIRRWDRLHRAPTVLEGSLSGWRSGTERKLYANPWIISRHIPDPNKMEGAPPTPSPAPNPLSPVCFIPFLSTPGKAELCREWGLAADGAPCHGMFCVWVVKAPLLTAPTQVNLGWG